MKFAFIMLFALLSGLVFAGSVPYVNITEPYNTTILQNGSLYLGKVGPGQTFVVTISALTQNYSGAVLTRGWNQLKVTGYPQGWLVQNSGLYTAYLSVEVSAAPNASNGTYELHFSAINNGNYSKIGAINFIGYINVTPSVFKMNVTPSSISGSPGEPTEISVTINNTGVSDSPFIINVSGLPAEKLSPETVIALHHTVGTFKYSISEDTPGIYSPVVSVHSLESALVKSSKTLRYTVRPSLLNDYYALGQGSPIFPVLYEPAYVLMYLISLLSKI